MYILKLIYDFDFIKYYGEISGNIVLVMDWNYWVFIYLKIFSYIR